MKSRAYSSAVSQAPSEAARDRRRTAILAAAMLGIFLAAVDGTVVTTAMPTAVRSLGGIDLYAWVFAIYMLTTAVSMPLWGKLADARGSRGLFILGALIFVVGSALSGASASMGQLVAFRALQGIGAGAMSAIPYTILGLAFPPELRARAIGLAAATWGIASIVGPLLGSTVVALAGWRWVFYVNLPVGAVAIWLAARFVPRTAAGGGQRTIDWSGAALVAGGVTALLLALLALQGGVGGRFSGPGPAVAAALAAALLLAAFVAVEARSPEPVLALFLFRIPIFAAANAIAFLSAFVAFAVIDYLPLLSPPGILPALGAAILVFPASVSWACSSFTTGRIVRRVGVRPVVFTGTALMAGGSILFLAMARPETAIWLKAAAAIPIGMGMGTLTPSLLSAVQNAIRLDQMGMGTASQQFLRQLGGTLGVSALQLAFLLRLAHAPAAVRGAADRLLLGGGGAGMTAAAFAGLTDALRQAYLLPMAAALIGFAVAWAIPRGSR